MAGSMMSKMISDTPLANSSLGFMSNNFAQMCSQLSGGSYTSNENSIVSNQEGSRVQEPQVPIVAGNGCYAGLVEDGPVNSMTSSSETDFCLNIETRDDHEESPYSNYLRQAETGERTDNQELSTPASRYACTERSRDRSSQVQEISVRR